MKAIYLFKIQTIIITILFLLWSCESDVDYGEQYKKTIYLVNSNGLLYQWEHSYGKDSVMEFAVYCASSKPISESITVRLKFEPAALDSLNEIKALSDPTYIPKLLLPEANYALPFDPVVTIEAGKQYGTLRVPFTTENLDPFVSYTLPMSIVSNSMDYDINPELRSIVYEPVMINDYSGSYTGISSESEKVARPVAPKLKALSFNSVYKPIHNLAGGLDFLSTNFMKLTINEDNMSVSITPIGNAIVIDNGGSFYDKERQTFELNYQFTNQAGKTFTIREIIVNVKAPVEEEL